MESRGLGKQRIIAVLLLACAVVLVAGAVWWTSRPSTSQSQAMASASAMPTQQAKESTAAPQQAQASYAPTVTDQQGLDIIHSQQRRDANDARAKGSIDAPVVMVLYSDFSCPYCTRFAQASRTATARSGRQRNLANRVARSGTNFAVFPPCRSGWHCCSQPGTFLGVRERSLWRSRPIRPPRVHDG